MQTTFSNYKINKGYYHFSKFDLKLLSQKNLCQRFGVGYLKNRRYESRGRVNVATPQKEEVFQTMLEQPMIDAEEFSWTKQWYPIQAVMHLDPTRPTGVQVLGKDLVIWRDGDGNWVCFEDQCPHRLVPLSEGRLQIDGTLQCSYHGWRFNGKGECVKIPQAEPELEKKLCSNERACAKTFPTQEKYGLLWIWGESGVDAHLESLQSNPIVPQAIQDGNFEQEQWQVRDLPYSHKFFLENVIDPAHVTVSHHGQQGSDRNNARPIYMKLDEPVHAQKWFKLYRSFDKKFLELKSFEKEQYTYLSFIPPSVVLYHNVGKDMVLDLVLIATPITKGKCRMFGVYSVNGKRAEEFKKNFSRIPKWYFHLQQNIFFQQDNVFLFKQEKFVEEKKVQGPITKKYYTPITSDLGVSSLHKWFLMHGQGGVQYHPEMVPSNPTENDLTDTYNAHTKHCKFCMDALKNFQRIQIGAWFACAICAICGICSAFVGAPMQLKLFGLGVVLPPLKFLGFGVFSAIFCGVGLLVNKTIERFYKTEFRHADN
eukprot:TRINITY_DN8211_c0_g1_i3.p1 TRINITY_DN8211_c0_g1~~TRINITY_DN8211_c0_g1_i3.p1  ORF type:complete len:539 (-),score=59.76 TRINITY_DN8211_c0_g1_i3:290-1906(-)